MTTTQMYPTLDIDDVRRAGGVREALLKWCEEDDYVSGGVVGSAFSTSGPGSGWTRNHGPNDFASQAFAGGALGYLDVDDGRMKVAIKADDTEEDDEIRTDIGGCRYREGEWTDDSVVRLEVPDIEDVLAHPKAAAEMAWSVAQTHGTRSDRAAWRKLVEQIRAAAEEFATIDLADLAD